MRYHIAVDTEELEVGLDDMHIEIEGQKMNAALHWLSCNEVQVSLDDKVHRVFVRRIGTGWRVHVRGRTFEIDIEDKRTRAIRELAGDPAADSSTPELRAPMPGLVVRVLVAPGQVVESGDSMLVIEAMKMENELRAENAGTVALVHPKPGQPVDKGDLLITFEVED